MSKRYVAAAVLVLPLMVSAVARAQEMSNEQRAAVLNEEGKDLWLKQDKLEQAVAKFQQAVVYSPEGRYYFNLCYALYQLARYREALQACEAVAPNGADEELAQKTDLVIEHIRKKLPPEPPLEPEPGPDETGVGQPVGDPNADPATGPDGDPATGYDTYPDTSADPNSAAGPNPGPDPGADPGMTPVTNPNSGTYPGAPQRGGGGDRLPPPDPIPGLDDEAQLKDDYKWSAGGEFSVIASSLGAEGGSGAGFKVYGSLMVLPQQRVGVQGYMQGVSTSFTPIDADFSDTLTIFDVGGAVFKHFAVNPLLYVTPVIGSHVTLMQPDFDVTFFTYGVRVDGALSLVLGRDRNHVISIVPGINFYTGVSEDVVYDLDTFGITFGLSVGYTLRFTTPFGQFPIIVLE